MSTFQDRASGHIWIQTFAGIIAILGFFGILVWTDLLPTGIKPENDSTPASPTTEPPSTSYRERFSTSIGTGVFSEVFYSDGMAKYTNEFLALNHGRFQSINALNSPTGCNRAQYSSNRIWFGSTRVTTVSINNEKIGTYDSPTFRASHGAILDWPVSVGDTICVELSPAMEFHVVVGPDIEIHYDSYCYRGHC